MASTIPKREEQRRRRNKVTGFDQVVVEDELRGPDLPIEVMDPHPLAKWWYEQLRRSGQAAFFESSDWADAAVWCDFLSRALRQGERPSAIMIQAWTAACNNLLTTEGARRRMRLELLRDEGVDEDEAASVTALAEYQKRLGS